MVVLLSKSRLLPPPPTGEVPMARVCVPPVPPPTVSESMVMLPSSSRFTVVLADMPGPMHTSSVEVGTAFEDQLPGVVHWPSPAVPVHVSVHVVGAAEAADGPS